MSAGIISLMCDAMQRQCVGFDHALCRCQRVQEEARIAEAGKAEARIAEAGEEEARTAEVGQEEARTAEGGQEEVRMTEVG